MEEFQRLPHSARKIALYSSTNFHILKPWAIISNITRFDLRIWQAQKPFHRRLKNREKVLEEFQRLRRFNRKKVLYSSTNFRILKHWTIISNFMKVDLGFWQSSKLFYRKLNYMENVLEEFQGLPLFPKKMFFYSSTNFRILKIWTVISKLTRFDLGFWKASIPFYRKVKNKKKVLEEFERLPRFLRKMVLYSSLKFCILNPWALILKIIRFHLGFWQASNPFYTKLKDREKVLEEFQRLSHFPIKMVLYLSTKFCILKTTAIISNLIGVDLGFWQASKLFYRKLKYSEKV